MEDKKIFLIALGKKIKRLREEQHMTLEELANKCGYTSENSRSTIQKIESGTNDIPSSKLKLLARALGTTPSSLLDCTNEIQKIQLCDLFGKCYGKEPHDAMQTFLLLDQNDRQVVMTMMRSLLSSDKYRGKTGLLNA